MRDGVFARDLKFGTRGVRRQSHVTEGRGQCGPGSLPLDWKASIVKPPGTIARLSDAAAVKPIAKAIGILLQR